MHVSRPSSVRSVATASQPVQWRALCRALPKQTQCIDENISSANWCSLYSTFQAVSGAAGVNKAAVENEDNLSTALQSLRQAAEEEDYRVAAELRDASLAWIGGWWRPISNPQARGINSSSSLLYVAHTEPSRWTGILFTPADFMHFDLQGNCNMSELQMQDMLQQARYGTPVFEVFVLPQQQQQQNQHMKSATGSSVPAAVPPPVSSSAEAQPTTSTSSARSTYLPVVVALQSVNRAFAELLGVRPVRRTQQPSPSEPRYVNQRLLVMVQPHGITAAAVHAGNDSTLWTWHMNTASCSADVLTSPTTITSGSLAVDAGNQSPAAASCRSDTGTAQHSTAGRGVSAAIQGPVRPVELSGGCRTGFTVDWHAIDYVRGPGSLQRTGTDTFCFSRQPLPPDVLQALCSTGNEAAWDSSNMRVFRTDLQYVLPPAAAQADAPKRAEEAPTETAGDTSSSSSSSPEDGVPVAGGAAAAEQPWADRVAVELSDLLRLEQTTTSCSLPAIDNSTMLKAFSSLLAAAAQGTAPPKGVVSEAQHVVSVTEVDLGAAAPRDADAAGAVEFVRVIEPTAALSFGGWQVTANLAP